MTGMVWADQILSVLSGEGQVTEDCILLAHRVSFLIYLIDTREEKS